MSPTSQSEAIKPSLKVNRVLKHLGERIRLARKKHRFRVKDFAERIGVAEGTAIRLEKGDPGIRMETFAMALMALGLLDRFKRLLDPADDDTGLLLEQELLPKRINRSRSRKPASLASTAPIGPEGLAPALTPWTPKDIPATEVMASRSCSDRVI